MSKTKAVGCCATTCKFNTLGVCGLKTIVLNHKGGCATYTIDVDKAQIEMEREWKLDALAKEIEEKEAAAAEPQRPIGFCAPEEGK